MSRKLKRVPLDFAAPLKEIWKGYICPFKVEDCHLCGGNGNSPEYDELDKQWFSFDETEYINLPSGSRYNNLALQYHLEQADVDVLWDEERLRDYKKKPSVKEVNEVYAHGMFGHDAINRWIVIKNRLKNQNLPYKCKHCDGSGSQSKEEMDRAKEWKPYEPPVGNGYQLWENCSEGSPDSPVFKTLDELCAYAEIHCTTFGSSKATKEEWKKMLLNDNVHHKSGPFIFM